MENLYYIAPEDKVFEEVKQQAIKIWQTYDNQFGYVDEKVGRIKEMQNVSDNMMYIVAMFDIQNQAQLSKALSAETKKEISDRMVTGGTEPEYNLFQ